MEAAILDLYSDTVFDPETRRETDTPPLIAMVWLVDVRGYSCDIGYVLLKAVWIVMLLTGERGWRPGFFT